MLCRDLIRLICSYLPMTWPTPCCGWFHDRKCQGGYVSSDGFELDCNLVLEKFPLDQPFDDEGENGPPQAVCRYHFDRGFIEPIPIHSPWYRWRSVSTAKQLYRRYLWFSILWLTPDSSTHSNAVDLDTPNFDTSPNRLFAPDMLVFQIETNRFGVVLSVITGSDYAIEVRLFDNDETARFRPEQLVFVSPTSVGEEVFSKRGNRASVLLIRMNQAIIRLNEEREEDEARISHDVHIVPIRELCLVAKSWHKRRKV